jgi:methionyl-tRNA synthetase
LPKNVPSNEFLNLEGRKISTSKNWAIWLHEFQKDFKDKQDSLRYYLCAISPEKKDSDFTWKDFQNRNNNELVDIYANFINRVIVLTNKYYDGIIPKISDLHSIDKDILKEIEKSIELVGYYIEKFEFKKSLMSFMNIARIGNKYLTDTEPWKLIKNDETRVRTIMNISIKVVAALSIISEPFLPFSSFQLREIIDIKNNCSWDFNISKIINEGHKIGTPKHLFSRISDEEIDKVIMKMEDEKK